MKDIAFLQQRLEEYACANDEEELNAIREILQELILAGLARTDFFTKAAFHGGTQLRIFEHLRRFSEDLDFALVEPDREFQLKQYLDRVAQELESIGVSVEVKDKSKASTTVKKGFLKNDSLVKLLEVRYVGKRGTMGTPAKLLIKLEIDTNPPAGAGYAAGTLMFPFLASVRNFDRSSSFSGKIHALLCRTYLKGRDWYDFVWYVSRGIKPNHRFLSAALDQQGQWAGKRVATDDEWVRRELKAKIAEMDFAAARADVLPFVHPFERPSLDLWSREFFAGLADRI